MSVTFYFAARTKPNNGMHPTAKQTASHLIEAEYAAGDAQR